MSGTSEDRQATRRSPLAWRQLSGQKRRFYVAVGGVSFGAVLMLFQLGIYQAFMIMAVRPLMAMRGDLAMISRDFQYVLTTEPFPERRLQQALALPDVEAVFPVSIQFGTWRNPDTGTQRKVALYGIYPFANPYTLPGLQDAAPILAQPDGALYDDTSPREFGDVVGRLQRDGVVYGEVNKHAIRVLGTYRHGRTLAVNGHMLVGMEAFRRVTARTGKDIELGMITLRVGASAAEVANTLNTLLPDDVEVLTREALIRREQGYWQRNSPLGFIVTAGMVIAMFVGSVIAYQTLYTDINDHMREYATLKAMGFGDGYFVRLVMQEAAILPAFGFAPALLATALLFRFAEAQGGIPTRLTLTDTVLVGGLTLVSCAIAGLLATRRLRAADPADIF